MVPADSQRNGYASHLNKRETRLILPLLGLATGLHFKIYLVANHLAGLLFFGLFACLVRRQTGDAGLAVLSTLAYALSYAGAHFFEDYYLGDGVAIVCLLAALVVRRPILITACVSLAAMTDERAMFASVLGYLYWQFQDCGISQPTFVKLVRPSKQGLAVIAGWGVFLVWRLGLELCFGLTTGHSDVANWPILIYHAQHYPSNLLTVYGWLGVLMLMASISAYLNYGKVVFWVLIFFAVISAAPAFLVYDFQRSISFGPSLLIIAFGILATTEPRLIRLAVATAFIGNLCLLCMPDAILRLACINWCF